LLALVCDDRLGIVLRALVLNHNVLEFLGLIPERAGDGEVVLLVDEVEFSALLMEAGEADMQRFGFVVREH
jgi:hypothetical protein